MRRGSGGRCDRPNVRKRARLRVRWGGYRCETRMQAGRRLARSPPHLLYRKFLRVEREQHQGPIEQLAFPPETEACFTDAGLPGFDQQEHGSRMMKRIRRQCLIFIAHRNTAHRSRAVEADHFIGGTGHRRFDSYGIQYRQRQETLHPGYARFGSTAYQ